MNRLGTVPACRMFLWCAAFWLASFAIAWGEMGVMQTFPAPRVRMRNSLTIDVDTRGPVSNGYRSVRVKVTNTPTRNKPAPVTADRSVRVVLETQGFGHLSTFTVSQVIEIPEQQSSAEATIAVPASGEWQQVKVNVYEGGDKLEDVSGAIVAGWMGMRDSETLPTLLFIDYDVPDRATRDRMVGAALVAPQTTTKPDNKLPDFSPLLVNIGYNNLGTAMGAQAIAPGQYTDAGLLALASQHGKVQLLPPAEMPKRWIDLSCYDVAFISYGDLARMAKEHAPQRRALVDWVHSGTTLVVYDAGNNLSQLAKIEELLELPSLSETSDGLKYGWPVSKGPRELISSNPQRTEVGRPAGLGWVVAFDSASPFPAGIPTSNSQFYSIPKVNQDWVQRHGISYQGYNAGLWKWYIPGVGAAPVFSFLLLATLFAIVIGPVNYVLLGHIGRLYLLLITVPVGAALVTAGLFAYAIVSDGLGIKARVRSFTLLDQQSGRAVSWSRQSYFASVVPSQGLKFPADTVVWPMEETPVMDYAAPRHHVAWEADGQRLKSGYLASRTLEQFMVIRSARSKARLAVTQQTAGAAPRVTNSLGGTIERLVLRDVEGKYYGADASLKPDGSTTLKLISQDEAERQMRQIIMDHHPAYPAGYEPSEEIRRMSRSQRFWSGFSSTPQWNTSMLEASLSSLGSKPDELVTPGAYFAVVDTNPDVPMGIAGAKELQSIHVIVGKW